MKPNIHQRPILILDFGSQYTQLIARRIREMGVYCELMPCRLDAQVIQDLAPAGIILSGGPESVTADHTLRAPDIVFKLGCPVLGICYGMQTMAAQLGGEVLLTEKAEFGHAQLRVLKENALFHGVSSEDPSKKGSLWLNVWMSHGDIVTQLPPGFESIGDTDNSPYAAMADLQRQFFGLQFHAEVTHTPQGHLILENFVKNICHCVPNWTLHNIIEDRIQAIRDQVGKESVIVGLSGGVDSAVTAALLHKAIGDQLTCVLVDTGLLRLCEAEEVVQICSKLGITVTVVKARNRFLRALKGVQDPEEKRKIIGEQFIRTFEDEAKKLKAVWLGQGTIYPDVIESAKTATGIGHVIKTHHNVGGLPLNMELKLIEPLRELFKDEVRRLGADLGLPAELLNRHPFPGPGLAVRILGEITPEYIAILKRADAIFIEELQKHNLYEKVSQAFAVFIPVRSVGVKGDARHYGYVIALRAVKTVDFMTARWAELPHSFLSEVSHRIANEIPEVSRVVYDITNKPPATIEWE